MADIRADNMEKQSHSLYKDLINYILCGFVNKMIQFELLKITTVLCLDTNLCRTAKYLHKF